MIIIIFLGFQFFSPDTTIEEPYLYVDFSENIIFEEFILQKTIYLEEYDSEKDQIVEFTISNQNNNDIKLSFVYGLEDIFKETLLEKTLRSKETKTISLPLKINNILSKI
jgi:hypothetical protein